MDDGSKIVVQMHGEPGSGKSTLARRIGARLNAVVLDKDATKAALLRNGIAERDAGPAAYDVYFEQARAIVEQGHSIVLDNPVFWEPVERRWLEIAAFAGSPAILIECMCSDRSELARRLATRHALESQPRVPLDLRQHPGAMATRFAPRLTIDTMRPIDELVDEAVAYVRTALAPTPMTDDRRLATRS